MDWSVLDLRKAAILKKEVDVALVALTKVQNDPVKRDLLIMSIQARIDELDAFCAAHDADDRTILFEKQQLRLRKAVQSQQLHQPPAPPQYIPKINTGNVNYGGDSVSANSPLSLSALNGQSSPAFRRAPSRPESISSSPVKSQSRSQKAVPPFNNSVRATHSHTLASVVLPPPPAEKIYDWEDNKDMVKKRMFLDGSSYCPTNKPGMYVREIRDQPLEPDVDEDGLPIREGGGFGNVVGLVGAEDLPDKFIDFQIVLTAEEMQTLISRKRITSRADIHLSKSQLASGNVHISTPYVDPSRVMRDHFRPSHPEKWVSKGDIRPNKQ